MTNIIADGKNIWIEEYIKTTPFQSRTIVEEKKRMEAIVRDVQSEVVMVANNTIIIRRKYISPLTTEAMENALKYLEHDKKLMEDFLKSLEITESSSEKTFCPEDMIAIIDNCTSKLKEVRNNIIKYYKMDNDLQ